MRRPWEERDTATRWSHRAVQRPQLALQWDNWHLGKSFVLDCIRRCPYSVSLIKQFEYVPDTFRSYQRAKQRPLSLKTLRSSRERQISTFTQLKRLSSSSSKCVSEEEKLKFCINSCSFCLCNSVCSLQSLDHVGHVASESEDLEY